VTILPTPEDLRFNFSCQNFTVTCYADRLASSRDYLNRSKSLQNTFTTEIAVLEIFQISKLNKQYHVTILPTPKVLQLKLQF